MATHSTGHLDDAALMVRPQAELSRLGNKALVPGGIGIALAAVGFLTARDTFLQSYLIAYIFWTGLTVGSLAVLRIDHLSGGAWGMVGRRVWEAATKNLPLMAVLFLPIALNLPTLSKWAMPGAADDPIIQTKAAYLNTSGFLMRAAVFFVVWIVLAYFLRKWSKEQDEEPAIVTGPRDRRFRVLSGPGLCLYV